MEVGRLMEGSRSTSQNDPRQGAAQVFREHRTVITYATQDEWEEHVPCRPVCPFANPFDKEGEFPASPVLQIRLDDLSL